MAKRRHFSSQKKFQIVLEILTGAKSLAQCSREYQVKDSLLYRWKAHFLETGPQMFERGQPAEQRRQAARSAELERLVGKLMLQLEVSKKASYYLKSQSLESEL